jgi:phospholipase C
MPIDHVVVLCLENRSFDHMLGYLDHPDQTFEGLRQGQHDNAPWEGQQRVAPAPGAKRVLPVGPDHSHDAVMEQLAITGVGSAKRPTNDGFVRSYERKARGLAPASMGGLLGPLLNIFVNKKAATAPKASGRGPLVMLCQDPVEVPVLSTLACEFAVFDHWFCSVPGETWPNRNYLHAATSDGETDIEIRLYEDPTIFELLEKNGKSWHIYHDDTPQVWAFVNVWNTPERHANWYPNDRFRQHVESGSLPHYSFIEPNHRPPVHTLDHESVLGGTPDVSNSQHPENNLVANSAYDQHNGATSTDFARAETLIADVYEALRANPKVFERTLLLITYDEHGGLYDHVPPPTDVPPPADGRKPFASLLHALWHRQAKSFDFTMLGPRVPTVLVSPLVVKATVVHDEFDHASVPKTLRTLFAPAARALTGRDDWARSFDGVASLSTAREDLPDLSAYTSPPQPTTAAATVAAAAPATLPHYYSDFVKQADLVVQEMRKVGEPEFHGPGAAGALAGAADTSAKFSEAAHRHRHPEESAPATVT